MIVLTKHYKPMSHLPTFLGIRRCKLFFPKTILKTQVFHYRVVPEIEHYFHITRYIVKIRRIELSDRVIKKLCECESALIRKLSSRSYVINFISALLLQASAYYENASYIYQVTRVVYISYN